MRNNFVSFAINEYSSSIELNCNCLIKISLLVIMMKFRSAGQSDVNIDRYDKGCVKKNSAENNFKL